MIGFEYIQGWNSFYTPLLTIFFGFVSFLSILAIGRILLNISKINIFYPWNLSAKIILGVFTLSLINQSIAILKINTYQIYILLVVILFILSVWELSKISSFKIKFYSKNFIPLTFLSLIFSIRFALSIIPSTKIDELNYHMLLPQRLVYDQALNYYQFPWEASILPHMHFQILGAPFYAIGFPDSMNLLSLGIFSTFVFIIYSIITEITKESSLGIWSAVLISTGLHSTVDLTTNASNALLILGSAISIIILCDPNKFLPTNNFKSFSIYYGLLFTASISSKVSMMPISFFMIFIFIKIINDYWSKKKLLIAFFYFLIPILIFYLPLLFYTWIESGSPFGTFLNSFFTGQEPIYDPYLDFREGNIGYRGEFKEILFFLLTKWSPLVWIAWIFIPISKINLRTKLVISFIFIIQFFIIWSLLPNRPRHFGGFQYSALILIFIEMLPKLYFQFRNYFIGLFILSTTPWIFLDFYYALPLISNAIVNPEKFKNDYVPFFYDFKEIDKLIQKNAQLFVIGTRLNNFHAPRKVFINQIDIKDKNLPTYLFLVGNEESYDLKGFKLKRKIYENAMAKKLCYRTPGKKCDLEKLSVYKIIFMD